MSTRVSYIEIDLPVCSRTYGVLPCEAEVGVTGDDKCYNTFATCQDQDNFDITTHTLRLSTPTLSLNPSLNSIPCISEVTHIPGRLNLGESIGARSVLNVVCRDFPFPDTGPGGDKYVTERDYKPEEQGSFWGKLQARQPWLRGSLLRWYNGDSKDDIGAMEMRQYIIDRLEGPNTSGIVRIIAKDPFTLLDDRRAIAPRITRGQIPSGGLDQGETTLIVAMPIGMSVEDEYPVSGFLAIGGNEIVSYTRDGDIFTIVRALYSTQDVDHEEGDRVQLCLNYVPQNPAEIMNDLLTNYGMVNSDFIPLELWTSEIDTFYGFPLTALIAEPTPVVDLINELLEQIGSTMWWSEVEGQIVFQIIRSVSQSAFVYDDNYMLKDSFQQRVLEDKRVSQVWTYYGQVSPLAGQEDPANYRVALASVNLKSETIHGTPAVKTIYSRWISQFAVENAGRLNALILSRFSSPPKEFEFTLLRAPGMPRPALGAGNQVRSYFLQDSSGAPDIRPTQITEVTASASTWRVRAEEVVIDEDVEVPIGTEKILPITVSIENFNMRQAFLDAYPEAESGDVITCQIAPGVIVSSGSTSLPAFDTGSGWPEGVTLKLNIFPNAYIVGKGGQGGSALSAKNSTASNGENGGTAMRIREAIEISNAGIIAGGGGGGAAAAAYARGDGFFGTTMTARAASSGGGGGGFGIAGTSNREVGSSGSLVNGGTTRYSSERDTSGIYFTEAEAFGGSGGELGQPGKEYDTVRAEVRVARNIVISTRTSNPGNAGIAVQGDSLGVWITEGDIRGSRVG